MGWAYSGKNFLAFAALRLGLRRYGEDPTRAAAGLPMNAHNAF
jgi:hypothetical protein